MTQTSSLAKFFEFVCQGQVVSYFSVDKETLVSAPVVFDVVLFVGMATADTVVVSEPCAGNISITIFGMVFGVLLRNYITYIASNNYVIFSLFFILTLWPKDNNINNNI